MDTSEPIITIIRYGIPTALLIFFIFYIITGAILSFHWRRYAFNKRAAHIFIGGYTLIGIALFSAGAIGTTLLFF